MAKGIDLVSLVLYLCHIKVDIESCTVYIMLWLMYCVEVLRPACVLRVTCCVLRVACCVLRAACCVLRVACCVLCPAS